MRLLLLIPARLATAKHCNDSRDEQFKGYFSVDCFCAYMEI